MKPLNEKEALPNSPLSKFGNFIVAVLKKRIFLLFLLLSVIAILLQLGIPEFSLPQVYTFGLVFVGFIWSAFQVYRELALEYQNTISQIHAEKILSSALAISPVNGNEYAYSISDPYSGQNQHITKMLKTKGVKSHFDERGVFFINGKVYYCMGRGSLEINLQIQNSGDLPLDILSMDVDNDLDLNHLLLIDKGVFLHGNKVRLPLHLESGELVILQSRYAIFINRGSHDALFAADIRSLPRSISHDFSIDTVDVEGKRQTYISGIKTSTRPLIDLYVKQWREYDQEEYLILAGYSLAGDKDLASQSIVTSGFRTSKE